MSYEGYVQKLCANGHLRSYDYYGDEEAWCEKCAPTPEPDSPTARCVWRPRKGCVALYAGCSNHAPHADMRGWRWCPYCGKPLSVEDI